jgi:hypothetical protein
MSSNTKSDYSKSLDESTLTLVVVVAFTLVVTPFLFWLFG